MYDNLRAQESITLHGNFLPPNETSTDDSLPQNVPKRGDIIPNERQLENGHDFVVTPRALDPTDDAEHDTAGLVRMGSL